MSNKPNFYEWLIARAGEDSIVGDLATDVKQDKGSVVLRKSSNYAEWKEHLYWHGSHVVDALREAFRQYDGTVIDEDEDEE